MLQPYKEKSTKRKFIRRTSINENCLAIRKTWALTFRCLEQCPQLEIIKITMARNKTNYFLNQDCAPTITEAKVVCTSKHLGGQLLQAPVSGSTRRAENQLTNFSVKMRS